MYEYCMNYCMNIYEHAVCVHWMDRAAAKEIAVARWSCLKLQNLYDRIPWALVCSCHVFEGPIQHVSVPWFHVYEMIWHEYDTSIESTASRLNFFSAMARVFLPPKESAKVKREDAQLIMRESQTWRWRKFGKSEIFSAYLSEDGWSSKRSSIGVCAYIYIYIYIHTYYIIYFDMTWILLEITLRYLPTELDCFVPFGWNWSALPGAQNLQARSWSLHWGILCD